MISTGKLEMLPLYHRATILPSYLDAMGHMNVQWYVVLFDKAAWNFSAAFGLNRGYFETEQAGAFALKQFIHYVAEVHAGETVAIRSRLVGYSAKRMHLVHFMINETTDVLAATMEVLVSHADLVARRTSPFPEPILAKLQAKVEEYNQLGWEAPVCGIIHP